MRLSSNIENPRGYSRNQIESVAAYASGQVKLICGVANNAALLFAADALDKVRESAAYNRRDSVRRAFRHWGGERKRYEDGLLYAAMPRFFRVSDMPPEIRSKYAATLTDTEYYEMWTSLGAPVYSDTRKWMTSLVNKYRLSIVRHGIPEPLPVAWAMAELAALKLTLRIWDSCVEDASSTFGLPAALLRRLWAPFRMERLCNAWERAMLQLAPVDYDLDPDEADNIVHGLRQLEQAWTSPDLYFKSGGEVAAEFGEVFASHDKHQAAVTDFAEMREEVKLQQTIK